MGRTGWLAPCTLIFALHCVAAFYLKGSPVTLLHSQDAFSENVLRRNEVCVVEFFAPWCPHCQSLTPVIEELAVKLKGLIPVYAVDCDDKDLKRLCNEQMIEGLPTIKIFPGESNWNPYTGSHYKDPTVYKGKAVAEDMRTAALRQLPDRHLTKLRSFAAWEAFREARNDSLPLAVFANESATARPLHRALSLRFKGRLVCALVRAKEAAVRDALGIDATPALVVLTRPDNVREVYRGDFSPADVAAFLELHADPEPQVDVTPTTTTATSETAAKQTAKMQRFTPHMIELTGVKDELAGSDSAWLVAVFQGSNDSCAESVAAWEAAVERLGNLTQAATVFVSASEIERVADLGLKPDFWSGRECEPQVVLLPPGDKDDRDWPVLAGTADAKHLQQLALAAFSTDAVPRLTAETLPHALGVNPFRPKIILLTDKPAAPPLFAALAFNFAPRGVDFFDIHGSETAALKQFGVESVPAVRLAYLPRDTEVKDNEPQRMAVQPYQGPMKYPALARFLESVVETFESADGAKSAEVDIMEVTGNDAAYEAACSAKAGRGLCIIALLSSSEGAAQHLGILRAAVARGKHLGLRYVWVEHSAHPHLASSAGLGASDVPALLAYSGTKQRVAALRGAFSEAGIDEFLRRLFEGKLETTLLEGPLTLAPSESPSKDAAAEQPIVAEDEFDLSDILSESVEGAAKSKADRLADIDAALQEEKASSPESPAPSSGASGKKRSKRRKHKRKKSEGSKTEL